MRRKIGQFRPIYAQGQVAGAGQSLAHVADETIETFVAPRRRQPEMVREVCGSRDVATMVMVTTVLRHRGSATIVGKAL